MPEKEKTEEAPGLDTLVVSAQRFFDEGTAAFVELRGLIAALRKEVGSIRKFGAFLDRLQIPGVR